MTKVFTKKQLKTKFKSLDAGWSLNKDETSVTRTFKFDSYLSGFMFVTKISVYAEVINHHPEVKLSYGQVIVNLSTHDLKQLSDLDFVLATHCDVVYTLSTPLKRLRKNK